VNHTSATDRLAGWNLIVPSTPVVVGGKECPLSLQQWYHWQHAWLQCERPQAVVFITTVTVTYSLGNRLHTLIAVPRLTQPSNLPGKVK